MYRMPPEISTLETGLSRACLNSGIQLEIHVSLELLKEPQTTATPETASPDDPHWKGLQTAITALIQQESLQLGKPATVHATITNLLPVRIELSFLPADRTLDTAGVTLPGVPDLAVQTIRARSDIKTFIIEQQVDMKQEPSIAGPNDDSAPCAGIVEDSNTDYRLLELMLKHIGIRGVRIENEHTFVDQVLQADVRLLILDIFMKEPNGFKLNQMLKTDLRTRHLPVIACTVSSDVERTLQYGFIEAIQKPVKKTDILPLGTYCEATGIPGVLLYSGKRFFDDFVAQNPPSSRWQCTWAAQPDRLVKFLENGLWFDWIVLHDPEDNEEKVLSLMDQIDAVSMGDRVLYFGSHAFAKDRAYHSIKAFYGGAYPDNAENLREILDTQQKQELAAGRKILERWYHIVNEEKPFLMPQFKKALREWPASMQRMRYHIVNRNPHETLHEAHSLKGYTSMLGMQEVSELAATIQNLLQEKKSHGTDWQSITGYFCVLRRLLDSIELCCPSLQSRFSE